MFWDRESRPTIRSSEVRGRRSMSQHTNSGQWRCRWGHQNCRGNVIDYFLLISFHFSDQQPLTVTEDSQQEIIYTGANKGKETCVYSNAHSLLGKSLSRDPQTLVSGDTCSSFYDAPAGSPQSFPLRPLLVPKKAK